MKMSKNAGLKTLVILAAALVAIVLWALFVRATYTPPSYDAVLLVLNGTVTPQTYDNVLLVIGNETPTTVVLVSASLNITLSPNSSITYNTTANVTGGVTTGDTPRNLSLYQNGTIINTATTGNLSNLSLLAAGSYNYTLRYNATTNYANTSMEAVLTVNKAGTTSNVSLSNITATYGGSITTNGTRLSGDPGHGTLYRNGTIINNGTGLLTNTSTLGVGSYNFTYVYDGNTNWTGSNSQAFLTVNTASSVISLNLSPATKSVNSSGSVVCGIGVGDPSARIVLYRNATLWANRTASVTNTTTDYGLGRYNFTCVYEASQNYSTSSTESTLTVTGPTIAFGTNISAAQFRPNITNATYVIERNASNVTIGVTNLTSLNNSADNQSSTNPLFNVSTEGMSANVTMYANVSGTAGGPAVIKCGLTMNSSQTLVLYNWSTTTIGTITNGTTAGIWCWMDYVNATSQYNFTLNLDSTT